MDLSLPSLEDCGCTTITKIGTITTQKTDADVGKAAVTYCFSDIFYQFGGMNYQFGRIFREFDRLFLSIWHQFEYFPETVDRNSDRNE